MLAMRRRWVAPLLIGVPILLAACDRSEADARAHLTAEGMRDVVLTHLVDEGSFHYTANRGDSRCAGNIHFQKDHRGTAIHD